MPRNRISPADRRKQEIDLARFGELALKSDDLDTILTEACRLARDVLATDLAKVVELQKDGRTLIVRAGVGWTRGIVGVATIMADENTSEGHCLQTGEPMISPNIAKEKRFKYPPFLIAHGVQAVANVIIIGGQDRPPFGVLQVDSRIPREFTESDTLFLRSYANLIAAAVDRIRVAKEIREHEAKLRSELLNTVAARTRELTEVNEKLKTEAVDRWKFEEALRQSMKMEAVGQLTGGLAHDFNNLLAIISGSLQLASKTISQGRTSEISQYIGAATASVDRAAALTHRLLAFSRRQTLDPKPTVINNLIKNMQEIFTRTVGPNIKIETNLANDLWPTFCDSNQLENAILNLVINARDAIPESGLIQIETSNSILTDWRSSQSSSISGRIPNGEYITLLVKDTGQGMSASVIERAFDPFFTTKPIGQGTGLGLSMIYGFVQQSGGHILLSSSEGHGTTVAIYLPRFLGSFSVPDETQEKIEFAAPERGIVILLVEDEPAIRQLMADVLTESGYQILQADNGVSAMPHLLSSARIDLLVSDVGLPGGMNGRQLAEAARQHRKDLKVLFVTGYAEQAMLSSELKDSDMEIISKPFNIEAFVAKVHHVVHAANEIHN